MGAARILGCAVQVEKNENAFDAVYTVSGQDAEALHQLCADNYIDPSPLKNGAFTIKESHLNDFEMGAQPPAAKAIAEALANATQELQLR